MSENKWQPRVWIHKDPIKTSSGQDCFSGYSYHLGESKPKKDCREYLSKEEHKHLLREREAQTWERASRMLGDPEDTKLVEVFEKLAREARGK